MLLHTWEMCFCIELIVGPGRFFHLHYIRCKILKGKRIIHYFKAKYRSLVWHSKDVFVIYEIYSKLSIGYCHKAYTLKYQSSKSYCWKLITRLIFFNYVKLKGLGSKYWYPQRGRVGMYTNVKYQCSGTYCSKVSNRVNLSDIITVLRTKTIYLPPTPEIRSRGHRIIFNTDPTILTL